LFNIKALAHFDIEILSITIKEIIVLF